MKTKIINELSGIDQELGVYYYNFITKEEFYINQKEKYKAASIIKIPIMIEVFNQIYHKKIALDKQFNIEKEDRLPDCGVLSYLSDDFPISLIDLCRLMIIVSDNTATNILIDTLSMDNINATMSKLGVSKTRINRKLFDHKEIEKDIDNYFSLEDMGLILKKLYYGKVISGEYSQKMIGILKNQQINDLIPWELPQKVIVAHKTGLDEGIIHNVGIVYSENPYILCLASDNYDVVKTGEIMRKVSRIIYSSQQK